MIPLLILFAATVGEAVALAHHRWELGIHLGILFVLTYTCIVALRIAEDRP